MMIEGLAYNAMIIKKSNNKETTTSNRFIIISQLIISESLWMTLFD